MHKLSTLLLALLCCAMSFAATYTGTCGTNLNWTLDTSTGVLSITGSGAMTDYGTNDAPWFSYSASISTVTIGNSVTSIGQFAFYGCQFLTAVTIPNSVTSIGLGAFYDCQFLTAVTIPNSVTSIGAAAFSGSSLTSVTIPNSVTSIDGSIFSGCSYLTSVTVDAGNTTYDSRNNSNSIIETATNTLIEGCKNTIIPNSVTSIGSYAFASCSGLTSVTIPNSITSIGSGAFGSCSGLTSITIPNSVTSIGSAAFSYCSNLTSASIGNSVTEIGRGTFEGCSSLTSVTIPNSVTSIGYQAFKGCSSLTSVAWEAVSYTHSSYSYYAPYAPFYDIRSQITSFTFGDSVQTIPAYLCYEMSNLTLVVIPSSVTTIGDYAFYNVPIIFYDGTAVGSPWGAYTRCYAADDQFYYYDDAKTQLAKVKNTSITSLAIPEGVDYISNSAFAGCDNLTSVTWKAANFPSPSSYSLAPFYNLRSQITSFTFGDSVQTIPDYLCYEMTGLKSVTIPNSVTAIGYQAFKGCSNRAFNRLILPQVKTIGESAFEGCSYLTSVVFGDKMESVGANAFKDCIRINDMTSYATITPEATENTFSGVSTMAYLFVQAGSARTYRLDPYWGVFDIRELGSDSTTVAGNQVTVVATDNEATFTWPTADNANAYSLVISKDGAVFCTLIFNANGQLQGIAFAPGRDGSSHAPAATMGIGGMTFTVSGMNQATKYSYRLAVTDAASAELAAYRGEFATTGYTGTIDTGGLPEGQTALDDLDAGVKSVKFLRDGQLYIRRGEHLYDSTGRLVE